MAFLATIADKYVGLSESCTEEGRTGKVETKLLTPIVLLHANIIVYAFAYWLCQPVLPFLSTSLGADAVIFGYLQTAFSLMQIVGGTVVGGQVDLQSPRFGMVLTQLGTSFSYLMLAGSVNLTILFASRIPTCFMAVMQVAQSFIPKLIADPKINPTKTAMSISVFLGKLSLSYGLGMIPGSFLGGILSEYIGYRGVAGVAGVLSLLFAYINHFFLPDVASGSTGNHSGQSSPASDTSNARVLGKVDEDASSPLKKKDGVSSSSTTAKTKDEGMIEKYINILSGNWQVRAVLLYLILVSFGFSMKQNTFSIAAIDRFKMTSAELGMFMSYSGIVGTIANIFLIKPLVFQVGDKKAVQISTLGLIFAFLFYSNIASKELLVINAIPVGICASIMYTVTTSLASATSGSENQGSVIALTHASRSGVGLVAPVVGGYLYEGVGFASVGISAAACAALALLSTLSIADTDIKKAR